MPPSPQPESSVNNNSNNSGGVLPADNNNNNTKSTGSENPLDDLASPTVVPRLDNNTNKINNKNYSMESSTRDSISPAAAAPAVGAPAVGAPAVADATPAASMDGTRVATAESNISSQAATPYTIDTDFAKFVPPDDRPLGLPNNAETGSSKRSSVLRRRHCETPNDPNSPASAAAASLMMMGTTSVVRAEIIATKNSNSATKTEMDPEDASCAFVPPQQDGVSLVLNKPVESKDQHCETPNDPTAPAPDDPGAAESLMLDTRDTKAEINSSHRATTSDSNQDGASVTVVPCQQDAVPPGLHKPMEPVGQCETSNDPTASAPAAALNLDARVTTAGINELDVLLGQGIHVLEHPGNLRFRDLVALRYEKYKANSCQQKRREIAHQIAQEVVNNNGRFLCKADPADEAEKRADDAARRYTDDEHEWVVADKRLVMKKVLLALWNNLKRGKPTGRSHLTMEESVRLFQIRKDSAAQLRSAAFERQKSATRAETNNTTISNIDVTSSESDQNDHSQSSLHREQDNHHVDQTYNSYNPEDVLLGQSNHARHHPGNIRLRHLVILRANDYKAAISQYNKREIAFQIAQEIKSNNGRFLCKVDAVEEAERHGVDANARRTDHNDVWVDAEKLYIVRKILGALSKRASKEPSQILQYLAKQLPPSDLTLDTRVAKDGSHNNNETNSIATTPESDPDVQRQVLQNVAGAKTRKNENSKAVHPDSDQDDASCASDYRQQDIQHVLLITENSVRRRKTPKASVVPAMTTTHVAIANTNNAFNPLDVLLGHDRHLQHHTGNIRFRDLVILRSDDYKRATSEEKRREIALQIAQEITNEKLRFLRKVDSTAKPKSRDNDANERYTYHEHEWDVAEKQHIMKKIRLALWNNLKRGKSRRVPSLKVEEHVRLSKIQNDSAEQQPPERHSSRFFRAATIPEGDQDVQQNKKPARRVKIQNESSSESGQDDLSLESDHQQQTIQHVSGTDQSYNPQDVLLGQGRHVRYHPGNVRFRRLIFLRSYDYSATTCKSKKRDIAVQIAQQIKNESGRFLRKVNHVWVVDEKLNIMKKIRLALFKKACLIPQSGQGACLTVMESLQVCQFRNDLATQLPPTASTSDNRFVKDDNITNLTNGAKSVAATPEDEVDDQHTVLQKKKAVRRSKIRRESSSESGQDDPFWGSDRRLQEAQPVFGVNNSYNPQDVLLGMESHAQQHPGNVRFRHLIFLRSFEFKASNCDIEKRDIAVQIAQQIRNENGRFLRKINHEWVVDEKRNIVKKIRLALLKKACLIPKSGQGACLTVVESLQVCQFRNDLATQLPPTALTSNTRLAKDDNITYLTNNVNSVATRKEPSFESDQDVLSLKSDQRDHDAHHASETNNSYNPEDILLGMGSHAKQHPGNIRFRNLIFLRSNEYKATHCESKKREIAAQIAQQIKNENGRFLCKINHEWVVDEKLNILKKIRLALLKKSRTIPKSGQGAPLAVEESVQLCQIQKDPTTQPPIDALTSDTRIPKDSNNKNNATNSVPTSPESDSDVQHEALLKEKSIRRTIIRKESSRVTRANNNGNINSVVSSSVSDKVDTAGASMRRHQGLQIFLQQPVAPKLHIRATRANTNTNSEVTSSESNKTDAAGASMHGHYDTPHGESDQQTKIRKDPVAPAPDASALDTCVVRVNKKSRVESLESDQDDSSFVSDPVDAAPACSPLNPQDVLLGPGSQARHHPGNIRFRKLLFLRSNEYKATNCEEEKREIANQIATEIAYENRRFIYLVDPSKVAEKLVLAASVRNADEQGVWVVAEKQRIVKKILQLLALVARKSPSEMGGNLI